MNRFLKVFSQQQNNLSLQPQVLAIDWGHFKLRLIKDGEVIFDQPSCFLFNEQSQAVLSLGNDSWENIGKTPPGSEVKFVLKEGSIYNQEYAAAFIQALWKQLNLQTSLPFLNSVKIKMALPNQATNLDKKLWTQVFSQVGAGKVLFVAKGEALLNSLPDDQRQNCDLLLLDIGAELTELTLCVKGRAAALHTIDLGSNQLTNNIKQKLASEYGLRVSNSSVHLIKHQISSNWLQAASDQTSKEAETGLRLNVRGVDSNENLVVTKTINQRSIYPLIQEWAEQLFSEIKLIFSDLDAETLVDVLSTGCLLSGGGSRLAGLDSFLADKLKTEVSLDQDPLLSVVRGAAVS